MKLSLLAVVISIIIYCISLADASAGELMDRVLQESQSRGERLEKISCELEEGSKRLEVEAWELGEMQSLQNEELRERRQLRFRYSDLEYLVHDLAEEITHCRLRIVQIQNEGTQFSHDLFNNFKGFVAEKAMTEHTEWTKIMSDWQEYRKKAGQELQDLVSFLKDTDNRMHSRIIEFIGTAPHDDSLVQKLLVMEQEILNQHIEAIRLMKTRMESFLEKCEEWLTERLKVWKDLWSERDAANDRVNQLESEIAKMARDVEDERVNSNKMIVMISSICGAILMVFVITSIGIYYKMKKRDSDEMQRLLKVDEEMPVVRNPHADRLGVNEHPEVRDQFGMNEVFDVTPDEGKDLVRIARPLETAAGERKLSEELMNIQPIRYGRQQEGGTTSQASNDGQATSTEGE